MKEAPQRPPEPPQYYMSNDNILVRLVKILWFIFVIIGLLATVILTPFSYLFFGVNMAYNFIDWKIDFEEKHNL